MNSQILNYREWIQANEKELNSLESALKPIMKKSLRKDFELHSAISSSMEKMHEAQQYILEKAKTQRKTAALIQREKNIGPDTEIKGTQITYLDDFSAKDSQIRVSLAKYNRNRRDLIKALKKQKKLTTSAKASIKLTDFSIPLYPLQKKKRAGMPMLLVSVAKK